MFLSTSTGVGAAWERAAKMAMAVQMTEDFIFEDFERLYVLKTRAVGKCWILRIDAGAEVCWMSGDDGGKGA